MSAADRPLDVRLALGAATAWIATAVLLSAAPDTVLLATLGLAALGGAALLLSGRFARAMSVVAAAAFCAVLVLGPLAARLAHRSASPLSRLADDRAAITADLTIDGDPRLLAPKGVAGAPRAAVDATLTGASVGGRHESLGGDVLVLGPAALWTDILPGQRVVIDAQLQPPLPGELIDAVLLVQSDPVREGAPPWWQRAAGAVRTSLRAAARPLPADVAGLLPGLVDGDTSGLDPVLAEHFRIAGLTHLVAVSGTNCAIVVGAVLLILRRARVGPRTCAVVCGVVLVLFVVVARPSPSVLRAALMAAVALGGLATGRERATLPALAATVLGLLVWQPGLSVDAGFTMSVLATAGLLLIAPGWADALRSKHIPAGLAEPIAVAAAAHLVTAPVIAAISGRVSLVAIPANVLAEPVVAVTTVVGFAAAVIAPISLPAGTALVWVASWPGRWLIVVADYFGSLHGATVPWPDGLVGGFALLAVVVVVVRVARTAGARRVLAAMVVVFVVIQIPVRSVVAGWPPAAWFFVACDVGQGDAVVLAAASHSAVVIDSGPDPVAVDRCLDDLGVTDVPLLVLSHYHLDHVGGISGVLHGRTVGAVVTGPLPQPAAGFALVHAALAARGLTIGAAPIGQTLQVGAVRLDFLAPIAAFHGTRSDPNNSSVIIRATVSGERIMLPGDAEVEAQQALVDSGVDLSADVLKVPHHGSAYSDPDFLRAVGAKVGIISVGLNNDYGLPSPLLLTELARLAVPVLRTDRDGDVAVVRTGSGITTVSRGTHASTVAARARTARGDVSRSCHDDLMAIDATSTAADDVALLGSIVLLLGDEELLVSRGIERVIAAARFADSGTEVTERVGSAVEGSELYELLSPSLFGASPRRRDPGRAGPQGRG